MGCRGTDGHDSFQVRSKIDLKVRSNAKKLTHETGTLGKTTGKTLGKSTPLVDRSEVLRPVKFPNFKDGCQTNVRSSGNPRRLAKQRPATGKRQE